MEEMSLLEAPRLWMQSVILVSCISCHILRALGPVAMPIQSNPFNYGVYNCNLVSAGFQVSAIKQCQCQSRINPKNPTVLAFNKKAYPTASHLTCYGFVSHFSIQRSSFYKALGEHVGEKGDEPTHGQQQLVFCDGKESVATGLAMENGANEGFVIGQVEQADEESEGKHSE